MRGQSEWNKFAAPYLKADRRGGMKAASAAWRKRRTESNPSGGKILKWGILGMAGYWAYNTFMKPKPVPKKEEEQPAG